MNKRDYYEILGLNRNSTDADIKKSYRQLAMKYHPDRNLGDDSSTAEEKFKEAKEAYEALSDPDRRRQYDAHGHADPSHGNQTRQWAHSTTADTGQFDEMFKAFFSQSKGQFTEGIFTQKPKQTASVQTITISLAEAYTGKTLKLDSGTIIIIPAGSRTGSKFYANNKLYRVDIQSHYKFKRSNDDLLVDVTIDAIEAILGVDAVLDHLDGAKLQFAIPAGIQPGQIVKLSNKGMRNPESDKCGDVLIRVSITIPKSLSDVQMAALKTLTHRESINI